MDACSASVVTACCYNNKKRTWGSPGSGGCLICLRPWLRCCAFPNLWGVVQKLTKPLSSSGYSLARCLFRNNWKSLINPGVTWKCNNTTNESCQIMLPQSSKGWALTKENDVLHIETNCLPWIWTTPWEMLYLFWREEPYLNALHFAICECNPFSFIETAVKPQ